MNIDVINPQSPYLFLWPDATEEYERADELRVSGPEIPRPTRLFVAYGWRNAFGQMRRRIVIFRNHGNVLAEFVGTDDWEATGRVATYLRKRGARTYLRPEDGTPAIYGDLELRNGAELFRGPSVRNATVAVADEGDVAALVRVAVAREAARQLKPGDEPRASRRVPPPQPVQATLGRRAAPAAHQIEANVSTLLSHRKEHRASGTFTGNADPDMFLQETPIAVLVAAAIDRGVFAERIWEIPYLLHQRLGHLDPFRLASYTELELERILRSLPALPRYPRQAARTIISLCQVVIHRHGGSAAHLWQGAPVQRVLDDLLAVWGIGPGIAHMTVLILMDDFGYQPTEEELRTIDVKPDVHLVRVFYRAGLSTEHTEAASLAAARQWHPTFPGALDWSAWDIGRNYCFPHHPDCAGCPLDSTCAKIGVAA